MKHLTFLAALLLMTAACGDNSPPSPDASGPFTWRDANAVWADAWCQSAERCIPREFANDFGDQATCRTVVLDLNCTSRDMCDEPYPADRRDALVQCHADMLAIKCSIADAPPSCYEAFSGR